MIIYGEATLEIVSETHSSADVTAALEIEPTKSHEKGDPRGESQKFFHKGSGWWLRVGSAATNEEESFASVAALVELLRGKADVLAELRANYTTRVWFHASCDSTHFSFVVPVELNAALDDLGLELYGDVYMGDLHPDGTVVEQAVLDVKPGLEADFEAAFEKAREIIIGMNGCREVTLSRGVEHPGKYLLLVRWDTVEDHEVGFRQSPEYAQWRDLLHHFYEPFPVVEHFFEVSRTLP